MLEYFVQELRSREDVVNLQAEMLNQREKALDAREMDILSRELKEMITKSTPMPNKRGGKFSKTKLKVSAPVAYTFAYAAVILLLNCCLLSINSE